MIRRMNKDCIRSFENTLMTSTYPRSKTWPSHVRAHGFGYVNRPQPLRGLPSVDAFLAITIASMMASQATVGAPAKKTEPSSTGVTSVHGHDSCYHMWFAPVSTEGTMYMHAFALCRWYTKPSVPCNVPHGLCVGLLKDSGHTCEQVMAPFSTCTYTCFAYPILGHLLRRSSSKGPLKQPEHSSLYYHEGIMVQRCPHTSFGHPNHFLPLLASCASPSFLVPWMARDM